jgi:hypothetical protein
MLYADSQCFNNQNMHSMLQKHSSQCFEMFKLVFPSNQDVQEVPHCFSKHFHPLQCLKASPPRFHLPLNKIIKIIYHEHKSDVNWKRIHSALLNSAHVSLFSWFWKNFKPLSGNVHNPQSCAYPHHKFSRLKSGVRWSVSDKTVAVVHRQVSKIKIKHLFIIFHKSFPMKPQSLFMSTTPHRISLVGRHKSPLNKKP